MKKNILLLTGVLLLFGLTFISYGQEIPAKPKQGIKEQLRNAIEIRQEMRRIEKQTIENDSELQGIMNKIKEQHLFLKEKLDAKLTNNAEYQDLKTRLGTMEKGWKAKGLYRPMGKPDSAPKSDKIKERKIQ